MIKRFRMTATQLLACAALMAAGTSLAADPAIKTDEMGLSRESVFNVPTPKVYHYGATLPGESKVLPRAYPGAPPQIPHDIADFLPITAQSNLCTSCHDLPDQWGKPREAGMATPMPPSHYTDLRNAPGKVTDQIVGARYNCNQCHVAQTDAPALVENTFLSGHQR